MVCPWCYVGTRRFEEVVARLRDDGKDVEVIHRAFELDPTVPPGGQDLADYLARKFGGSGRVAHSHARLSLLGGDVGIDFRWEGKRRLNTFDAHRLAAWALETAGPEVQGALVQRLFRAYFTDNLDIAGQIGQHAVVGDLDIHAVPTFVIDGRWSIPGAQDVDTFVRLLGKVA